MLQKSLKFNEMGVSFTVTPLILIIGGSCVAAGFTFCCFCIWCIHASRQTEEFKSMKQCSSSYEKYQLGKAALMVTGNNAKRAVKQAVITVATKPASVFVRSEKARRTLNTVRAAVKTKLLSKRIESLSSSAQRGHQPVDAPGMKEDNIKNAAESLLVFARGNNSSKSSKKQQPARLTQTNGRFARIRGMVKGLALLKTSKTAPAPDEENTTKHDKTLANLFSHEEDIGRGVNDAELRAQGETLLHRGNQLLTHGKVQHEPNTVFQGPSTKPSNQHSAERTETTSGTRGGGISIPFPKVAAVWSSRASPYPSSDAEEVVDFSSLSTLNDTSS